MTGPRHVVPGEGGRRPPEAGNRRDGGGHAPAGTVGPHAAQEQVAARRPALRGDAQKVAPEPGAGGPPAPGAAARGGAGPEAAGLPPGKAGAGAPAPGMSAGAGSSPAAPVTAFLGLGANVGDPRAQLRWAVGQLARAPGVEVTGVASLYGSKPVGVTDQPDFLNTVVAVRTVLPPRDLLALGLELERRAGRVRLRRWGPRTLDIDLLWYDGRVIDQAPELIVPHPRLAERAFVLVPWAELAPATPVPGLGTVARLCAAVDRSGVWLVERAPGWLEPAPPPAGPAPGSGRPQVPGDDGRA